MNASAKKTPDQIANQFFKSLMHNQCHDCWKMLSSHSQKKFIDWVIQDIYQRHGQAAQLAKIGPLEVKLLFENNDATLMKTFWKHFFFASGANDFFRYAYYHTVEQAGKNATVGVLFKYPNGQTAKTVLKMLYERGDWKLGYLESGFPI